MMPLHKSAKEIAPKVKYEWDMFICVANHITVECEQRIADQFTKNILLEVFLLHARVLHDFLVKSPRKCDDVHAFHFFDKASDWEHVLLSSNFCPYLQKNRERLNKKLTHLTYRRLTENERWDTCTVRDEVSYAWHTFLKTLPEDRREWFA